MYRLGNFFVLNVKFFPKKIGSLLTGVFADKRIMGDGAGGFINGNVAVFITTNC